MVMQIEDQKVSLHSEFELNTFFFSLKILQTKFWIIEISMYIHFKRD